MFSSKTLRPFHIAVVQVYTVYSNISWSDVHSDFWSAPKLGDLPTLLKYKCTANSADQMFTLTFDQLQNLATFPHRWSTSVQQNQLTRCSLWPLISSKTWRPSHIAEVQVNCKISRSEMFTLTFDLDTALVDALGLDEKPDDTIELRVRILQ